MVSRNKKFPKSSLFVAILCAILILAFIVFYITGNKDVKYFWAIIAVMGLLMPVFIVFAFLNIKHCLNYYKFEKVKQFGINGVCQIIDFQTRKYNNNKWNVRYSLIVRYYDNDIEKTFTTSYDYIKEEYDYLITKEEIKCKYKGNLLYITEKIPDKIYKDLTIYGKEKSKFMRVFILLWQILGYIGAALTLVGIAAMIITENHLYLIIGVLCAFVLNLICGLIYGLHFIITGE